MDETTVRLCATPTPPAEALPDHPKHAERLWDAAQCFQNAHLVGQALRARLQLIKEHPKDKLAEKALFRVAAGYHQLLLKTRDRLREILGT